MNSRQTQIKEIQESLPKPNGLYLNIVLGGINTSLIDSEQRFKYKEQYERFKLVVTCFILVVSLMDLIFQSRSALYYIWVYVILNIIIIELNRVCDALLHFLLVWYHCTLTIRESILVVNGSRIKGWWRTLHFLTTINAGVMVVWYELILVSQFICLSIYYSLCLIKGPTA